MCTMSFSTSEKLINQIYFTSFLTEHTKRTALSSIFSCNYLSLKAFPRIESSIGTCKCVAFNFYTKRKTNNNHKRK